nr:MAG TPA: hypothetical protein [Caudoviricetes sp.]
MRKSYPQNSKRVHLQLTDFTKLKNPTLIITNK